MTRCLCCGLELADPDSALCFAHQPTAFPDEWAVSNRIMCDLLHRGVAPARVNALDRRDDFWSAVADVGG